MHELSMADAIAKIAARHADGRTVMRVEVRVGHLRQVVPASLELAWQLITKDTALDGAGLAIEHAPATARCAACGATHELKEFPARCHACGSLDVDVAGGDDLVVDALALEHAPAAPMAVVEENLVGDL